MMFRPPTCGPLWLASRSPRRKHLLEEAGVPVCVRPAGIDDAALTPGRVCPAHWVMALAYLKGRWVAEALEGDTSVEPIGTVLAADTICVHEGCFLGQPMSEESARRMLKAMRDDTHITMTGVCLISLHDRRRWLLVDESAVRWGAISDDAIEAYLASGEWRGKAGAYNLCERQAAGWPIECEGDPATVMGLPMRRLDAWFGCVREVSP